MCLSLSLSPLISRSFDWTTQQKMREGAAQPLTASDATYLLHSVDAFLFDCDGVIWKGDTLIDGVPQTLDLLRSKGKKLVFVTNNSTKSRRQYATKFHSLGIPVSEDEIFSSSFAAAMYLKSIEFPRDKKVYVVGGEGILEELQLAGFTGLGGPEDGKKTVDLKENCFFEHDRGVRAVVVGLDLYINYYKIQRGLMNYWIDPSDPQMMNISLLPFSIPMSRNQSPYFLLSNGSGKSSMSPLKGWPFPM